MTESSGDVTNDERNRQDETRKLVERVDATLREYYMHRWRSMLGDRLEGMLASRSVAETFLADPNPRVRAGAFWVVLVHWEPDRLDEDTYWQAALHDVDPYVRNAAGICLTRLYTGTAHAKLSAMHARTIKDESISIGLRLAAYSNLARVRGIEIPYDLMLEMRESKKNNIGLPSGLDWTMVESCLLQAQTGDPSADEKSEKTNMENSKGSGDFDADAENKDSLAD